MIMPVSPLSPEESAAADLFGPDDGFVEEEAVLSSNLDDGEKIRVDDADGERCGDQAPFHHRMNYRDLAFDPCLECGFQGAQQVFNCLHCALSPSI